MSPRPEAARQAVVAAERRRHARVAICSGAVVAAASALVIAASPGTRSSSRPNKLRQPRQRHPLGLLSTEPTAAPCQAKDLSLELGGNVSPMTGERPAAWLLTNTSPNPCSLYGFTQVDLFAADGATVPFSYTRTSPYIRWPTPNRLVLAPRGAPALLWISTYRCDGGDETVAVRVRIHLDVGGLTGPVESSLRASCIGGPKDPGQTVSVNPFVAAR